MSSTFLSIPCMVYLPTVLVDVECKCRQIDENVDAMGLKPLLHAIEPMRLVALKGTQLLTWDEW